MLARCQRVILVGAFLVGFITVPWGLVALARHPIIGVILILSGMALVIQSVAGLYEEKSSGAGK